MKTLNFNFTLNRLQILNLKYSKLNKNIKTIYKKYYNIKNILNKKILLIIK